MREGGLSGSESNLDARGRSYCSRKRLSLLKIYRESEGAAGIYEDHRRVLSLFHSFKTLTVPEKAVPGTNIRCAAGICRVRPDTRKFGAP